MTKLNMPHFESDLENENKIAAQTQHSELKRIESGHREECFNIIFDFKSNRIVSCFNLECMGYDSLKFEAKNLADAVYFEGISQVYRLFIETINEFEKTEIEFLSPKFVTQIPFRTKNGEVYLVKRVASPWQILNNNKISQILIEFSIIKKQFDSDPFFPRYINLKQEVESLIEKKIHSIFYQNKLFKNPFSPKEIIIINVYANTSLDIPIKEIAALPEINLELSTLHFYNKKILEKARDFFQDSVHFKTAFEVALYLKNCGLI